jgi:hypothetical protein
MAKKIDQKALSAAIAKFNEKCPYCVRGKIGKVTCGQCGGTGKKR